MAGIGGFHHVALWTTNFDRSVAFYTGALGLTPRYQFKIGSGRAMILRCGTHGHVEIFERPVDWPAAPAEARLLHFALETDDVDGWYARAIAGGATPRTPPKDVEQPNQLPGGLATFRVRLAFFTGPDGEIVELFQDRGV